jgi:hypothetical protein
VEISIAFFLFLLPTAGESFVPAEDAPTFGAAIAGYGGSPATMSHFEQNSRWLFLDEKAT